MRVFSSRRFLRLLVVCATAEIPFNLFTPPKHIEFVIAVPASNRIEFETMN